MTFQAAGSLGLPHEPKLEDVSSPAALNVLVSGVILGVVELVFLEEVGGASRVGI